MSAFARFLSGLSLAAFGVACSGGRSDAPTPPALSANSNLADLSKGHNDIVVQVSAAIGKMTRTYLLTITRQTVATLAQDAYNKVSNTNAGDQFGLSVALPSDTHAVDAFPESSVGAVYVFQ